MSDLRSPLSPPRSDAILAILDAQRRRIVTRLLLRGAGIVVAAIVGALVVYYVTDRGLSLPTGIRLLLTTGWVVLLIWLSRQQLVWPLNLRLGEGDVAVAIERRFPELRERLISALQLAEMAATKANPRDQSQAMIDRVVADASTAVATLRTDEFLTWRHVGRAWLAAGLAMVIAAPGIITNREVVQVFLQRMFGADIAYPRQTSLFVELPPSDQDYHVERDGDRATLTMAAGSDLPILVRADGVVPREVLLMLEGGRGLPSQVTTAVRGGGRFRHVFRRVTDSFEFHARGGDDDRGDLHVSVNAVRPARVGSIRAALQFPDYTGRAPAVQEGGAIEALEGTAVSLDVAPLGEVTGARLIFQESGDIVELTATRVEDDGGVRTVYRGGFAVRKTDRYQVELVSSDGLRNPQGASYPVIAVADAPPSGQILTPQDDGLNAVLPNGIVALRALVRDDFRLTAVTAEVLIGDRTAPVIRTLGSAAELQQAQAVLTSLHPLAGLLGDGASVKEGESLTWNVILVDNRAPEPRTTKLPARTLHVVSLGDLERRIAAHFRRVRTDVEKALELQRERRDRLVTLTEEIAKMTVQESNAALTAMQVAQGRVQSLGSRVHLELMRSFNVHLFNPMDDATPLAPFHERYATFHRASNDARPFLPEFYRELAVDKAAKRIGSLGKFLDRVLTMTASADAIAERLGPKCIQAFSAARGDRGEVQLRLGEAKTAQDQLVDELSALLAQLDEWNEFQDVISTTRALRDHQRDVQSRTQTMRK